MGSKMSAGACAGAEKDKVLREAFLSLAVVARDALLYLVTLSDLLRLTFCRTGLAGGEAPPLPATLPLSRHDFGFAKGLSAYAPEYLDAWSRDTRCVS